MLDTYRSVDPPTKLKALITPSIIKSIIKKVNSSYEKFIKYLILGTFFFAVRSYKYVATSGESRIQIVTSD